ncbi:MAG: hypothetical protein CL566_08130 [Alphaproteobacteria bacterium]|jgi:hypothetical protein|nr:hypothetical protein [Alphaproteobacteria bacterium]
MNDNNETTDPAEAPGTAESATTRDPVADAILACLAAAKPGGSASPEDVARTVAEVRRKPSDPPDLWRRYLPAVKQQAISLARAGSIQVLRKGKPVDDPAHVKGIIRYRLPA